MNTRINIFILSIMGLGAVSCASVRNARLSEDQRQELRIKDSIEAIERTAEVNELLDKRHYKVIIYRAYSVNLKAPFHDATGYYRFKVEGDKVESLLPYFGKVTNQPQIGRRSPLDFSSSTIKYMEQSPSTKVSNPPMREVRIDIRNTSTGIPYDVFMQFYDNGNVSMNVTGPNIESMQYTGEIKRIE